jgi:hypothetical protein
MPTPDHAHEYVVERGWSRRAASVLLRYLMATHPLLAFSPVILILVLALVELLSGRNPLGFAAVALVLFGLAVLAYRAFLVWSLDRQVPVGTVSRISFGAEALTMEIPGDTSTTEYSKFTGAVRRGDFVVLRKRGGAGWLVLPGASVPDEALAHFPRR